MTIFIDDIKDRQVNRIDFPFDDIVKYLHMGTHLTMLEDKRAAEGHEQRSTIFVVVSEDPLLLRVAATSIKVRD